MRHGKNMVASKGTFRHSTRHVITGGVGGHYIRTTSAPMMMNKRQSGISDPYKCATITARFKAPRRTQKHAGR